MGIHMMPASILTMPAPKTSPTTSPKPSTSSSNACAGDTAPVPAPDSFRDVLGNVTQKSDKIADTAKQFEALIAGQVLKAARQASDGGWLGTDSDDAGQLAIEVAEQGLAQALASQGTLGIAKLVTPTLRRQQAAEDAKPANSGLAPMNQLDPSKGCSH